VSTATQGVLIIEDDPEMQYLLTVMLEDDDRTLMTAGTGAEAEELLGREVVDLIVLDLILPDTDGRTLLTRFRERPETATIPIVVISARGGVEIRQDCYALGADSFTEKPFDPDEVAADISARLERSVGRAGAGTLDPVTGLLNRAGLLTHFKHVESESGLALIQLDGFLTVSERWGWSAAEEFLRRVGGAIGAAAGQDLVTARLGGGEFVVFASGRGGTPITAAAEEVLKAIRDLPIADPDGETFRMTASIGVVSVPPGATLDDALDGARRRLGRAKEAGRNQVVAEDVAFEGDRTRILVAEDDEISATILLHRLKKEGLDVTRFDNGREVYERALEDTPDMLILDVKMPGMDGFEVLERLRRTPSFSRVPIIMLTSMGSEADVVRGFQLGADDYILKPFSPIELSARVWRLLRRGRSEGAL
jgi:diguanylate cyclase (GGDEF)-like protein